jgi:hypothetical protein
MAFGNPVICVLVVSGKSVGISKLIYRGSLKNKFNYLRNFEG